MTVSPEGTQDKNRMPTIKPSASAATLNGAPWGDSGMRKHRILAPDSWGIYQRNDFNEPRLLHLPIHRKALNSLTWDVCFPLINSNLLMFHRSGFCYKTPIYPGSSLISLGQSLRAIWEAVSQAWDPQKVHWIKHNPQLLGCAFFFSRQVAVQVSIWDFPWTSRP